MFGIIGLILSIFIGILALPLNIVAMVKGVKLKKYTGKVETGFILSIIGIIISVIMSVVFTWSLYTIYNYFAQEKSKEERYEYKNDIVEENKDYFTYSLEEYTYDYELEATDCFLLKCDSMARKYTIKYYDYGYKEIKISNNHELEDQLERIINDIIEEAFEDEKQKLIIDFNKSEIFKTGVILNQDLFNIFIRKIDENIDYSDSKNGVILKGINTKNLKNNNLRVEMQISLGLKEDISQYPNLKNDLINTFSSVFNNFEDDNLEMKITITDDYYSSDRNNKQTVTYILNYNSSSGHTWTEK